MTDENKRRNVADELAVVFTDEDARAEVEAAERFLGDALAFLRSEGWVS